ncbi:MAG: 23S rRNA (adenine(2503)-C(2))-methyltransferase RlmN [Anaerolineales bacterium]|jgi:23S rRNA (adenine2503-C2)-methyltransferase
MESKPFIFDLDHSDIHQVLSTLGEPKYRTNQIWKGLYQQMLDDFEQFTSLPLTLRGLLNDKFAISQLQPAKTLTSKDGMTTKTLFLLPDDMAIEAVLMRYAKRRTLCISTQAGCALGCVFCATGQMGFGRNLSSGEIIEQVVVFARQLKEQGERITNIVLMGMGEPFHNYDATMEAIERLNNEDGYNLGMRRFTISTVGVVPAIRRFTSENSQVNLAVSLHAANDELRSTMLPINDKYPLDVLLDACRDYVNITHRRITFEWALIKDINDSQEQAQELAKRLHNIHCHVNLIPLNPTHQYHNPPSSHQKVQAFKAILEEQGIPCSVRLRRGIEIQAGCGQLAIKN